MNNRRRAKTIFHHSSLKLLYVRDLSRLIEWTTLLGHTVINQKIDKRKKGKESSGLRSFSKSYLKININVYTKKLHIVDCGFYL